MGNGAPGSVRRGGRGGQAREAEQKRKVYPTYDHCLVMRRSWLPGLVATTGCCVRSWSLALAVLSVAGCGTDATPPGLDMKPDTGVFNISCTNGVRDGDESDVDCGGADCAACVVGATCRADADCASGHCIGGRCLDPPCMNQVKDRLETDVDCGGLECPPCGDGKRCGAAGDCSGASCIRNVCRMPLACMPGTADCDLDPGNGCEVTPESDDLHCGTCDNACPAPTPLCKKGKCEAAVKVLIVHSTNGGKALSDLQARLVATGAFVSVDAFDASRQLGKTPDLAALKPYQAVLVWTDSALLDADSLGNNLADYHDAGGRVVVAYEYNDNGPSYCVRGRFADPVAGYLLIECGDNKADADTLGAVNEPLSPLMKDVVKLDTMAGRNFARVTHGGVVVATWASGQPLVVRGTAKGRKRVDLNLWPAVYDGGMNSRFGWTGDGASLLRNALLYQ